jgi:hypothetical protein
MNTTDLACTKKDDIASEHHHEIGSDIESLLGTWRNVSAKTGQIARVDVVAKGGEIFFHCFGQLEDSEMDWGPTPCQLFSSSVDVAVIDGFGCNYDFGFMEVRVVGNMKYGTMVIQSYNTFKDNSGRNDYFCREFFAKH